MVTQIVIGRIRRRAPGVSNAGADHAWQTPKLGVGSPESAQGKGSRLGPRGAFLVSRHLALLRWSGTRGRRQARLPGGLGRPFRPGQGKTNHSGRRQPQTEDQDGCFEQT
jgi:hypothetical protein